MNTQKFNLRELPHRNPHILSISSSRLQTRAAHQKPKNQPLIVDFNSRKRQRTLEIFQQGKYLAIPHEEILYCEASGNYSFVHLKQGNRFLVSKTLKQLKKELQSRNFIRTHQSYMVNKHFIDKIVSSNRIELRYLDQIEHIPISRRKLKQVTHELSRY